MSFVEENHRDAFDVTEDFHGLASPDWLRSGRSIWVISPVTVNLAFRPIRLEHLQLVGCRVLGFIEDYKGVIKGSPAHEGKRSDLDDPPS